MVAYPSILTKVLVIEKVMDDPIVKDVIPNFTRLAKDVVVQKELLSKVVQSLSKVKRPSNIAKFVTKHTILIALMNGSSTNLSRQKTQLVKVHLRNIAIGSSCDLQEISSSH
jgi:hypothetical protein